MLRACVRTVSIADLQREGDLRVRATLAQQLQHLALARGQQRVPGVRPRGVRRERRAASPAGRATRGGSRCARRAPACPSRGMRWRRRRAAGRTRRSTVRRRAGPGACAGCSMLSSRTSAGSRSAPDVEDQHARADALAARTRDALVGDVLRDHDRRSGRRRAAARRPSASRSSKRAMATVIGERACMGEAHRLRPSRYIGIAAPKGEPARHPSLTRRLPPRSPALR